MANPGASVGSGALITPGGAQGPQGATGGSGSAGSPGPAGANAWTLSAAGMTVPAVGSTVSIAVQDASWVAVGETIYCDKAAADGTAAALVVTAKAGNTLTLLNPVVSTLALANTGAPGLLAQTSGAVSDYLGGDNAFHPLSSFVPTGTILEFAGNTIPAGGWLWADGSTVSRTTYAALFAALGTTYGTGDGSTTFNVPYRRGRVAIGAGTGTGLTNRVLAAKGGEENHQLTTAELASHAHFVDVVSAGYSAGGGQVWGVVDHNTSGNMWQARTSGSDTPHNNMQPYLVCNYILKT